MPTMPAGEPECRLDEFFAGRAEARELFEVVRKAVEAAGLARMRVTKSQIAFRRLRGFAWAWTPGRYLRGETAPLVLSLALSERDSSRRWKQVVEPAPGRYVHHLELRSAADVDAEVRAWLARAWAEAGAP